MADELMYSWIVTGATEIKFLSLSSLAPSNVNSVSVIDRKENQITLQWSKVNNSNDYGYELYRNEENSSIPISQTNTVEYNVTSLDAGTEYFFTLYTVFGHVMSSGYNFTNVTSEYIILVNLQ